MTARETILAVATELDSPFSFGQLLLACWRRDNNSFGLPGFKELYPDARKLQNALYSRRSVLLRRELLVCGDDYRLPVVGEPKVSITEPALVKANESGAALLFEEGLKDGITFTDALEFWGLPPRPEVGMVEPAVKAFAALLNGRPTEEHRVLGACHDWLTERFARHIRLSDGKKSDRTNLGHKQGKENKRLLAKEMGVKP